MATDSREEGQISPLNLFGGGSEQELPLTLDAPHAETFSVNATPERLAEDIFRSIQEMQWGRIRYSHWHPHGREPGQPVVWGQALLPRGETLHVLAWPAAGQRETLHVAMRIGPFGRPDEQARFRKALASFLDGPRMRQYQGDFDLPAYPGTRRWQMQQEQQEQQAE